MVFFDTENISINLKKIEYYKNEEQQNLNNIKTVLYRINSCFNTDNKDGLEQIVNILTGKMQTINIIHNNNTIVLEHRIQKEKELETTNIQLLSENGGQE